MSGRDWSLGPLQTVDLELLRPGPAHGQLLSPLTSYMALCGDEGPVTLRIELEHWRLMNRLRRLRYVARDRRRGVFMAVPDPVRESEILDLGGEIGRILAGIPTLVSELGRAAGRLGSDAAGEAGLVHLRLILSGSELSLLPFELVTSPLGFPGDGLAMLLQTRMPIIVTREVRRGKASEIDWTRPPRILFVSAAPGPLTVPVRAHLRALRGALDPWVNWAPDAAGRVKNLSELITVLPDASVERIEEECAKNDYTHVHILAHGDAREEAGELRYGVALCDHADRSRKVVVDGKRLAEALRVARKTCGTRSRPLVATLATCDSGNVNSVVVPGGSIAHDLHAFGIPWVFASQFPLTKSGSVRMARILYGGLLEGEDPRCLLHRLRTALHVGGHGDHDWASLVAYASIPEDFDVQVHWFRSKQMRRAAEADLYRANLFNKAEDYEKADAAIEEARGQLEIWEKGLPGENWGRGAHKLVQMEVQGLRGECYGVCGATEKQLAGIYHARGAEEQSKEALVRARGYYQRAMASGLHWTATQYLSLGAVLLKGPEPDLLDGTFYFGREDLAGRDRESVAWAHGTLAELELLRLYHKPPTGRGAATARKSIASEAVAHCKEIVEMMGFDSFHVFSTRRQFERYRDWWKNDLWQDVANSAVEALTPAGEATSEEDSARST